MSEDLEWRRGARVCGVWLVSASVIAPLAVAFQTHHALSRFGEGNLSGSVVVLSLVRLIAARAVAWSAWLGVCSATRSGVRFPVEAFLAAPALYPIPILLGVPVCFAALGFADGGGDSQFWSSVVHQLKPIDFVSGVARTSAYVLGLSGLGRALPRARRTPPKRGPRIVITALLGAMVMWIVDVAFGIATGAW